jgi:hypothetical protein
LARSNAFYNWPLKDILMGMDFIRAEQRADLLTRYAAKRR